VAGRRRGVRTVDHRLPRLGGHIHTPVSRYLRRIASRFRSTRADDI
jgi:hypothetical protein